MENKDQIKKAYKEIYDICKKYDSEPYSDEFEYRDIRDMRDKAENHLMLIEWYEKYGLLIKHDRQLRGYNYVKINNYMYFSYFKEAKEDKENGRGRYISWEDNDKQPKNEWLLCLNFPTGAYIFGDDYPKDLFKKFWLELKSYNPQYCDTTNKSMYFTLDTAKEIYNKFDEILKKYYEINKGEREKRKIKKLKEELKKLTNKT